MEKLALIGTSQRRGGTDSLEAWSDWISKMDSWPSEWVDEVVPILTCNRCDLVVTLARGASLEHVMESLIPAGLPNGYGFFEEEALEQLCRIASSLDSLNPGEDQIMSQVRCAYEEAKAKGTTGKTTSFAFQTALRIAKRVRREIPLAPANTSLFSLAKPEVEARLEPGATIAILGAGEMGTLAAKSLEDGPYRVLIVNRTAERGECLAAQVGAESMSLEAFVDLAPHVDAIVCATQVNHLVDEAFLARHPRVSLIVDLGLPRNVDPLATQAADVHLIDQNWLEVLGEERRARLQKNLVKAEEVIQSEMVLARGEWAEKQLGESVVKIRDQYFSLLKEMLGDLLSEDKLEGIASRFAHLPIKGLKGLARHKGLAAAELFLQEAGIEFSGEDLLGKQSKQEN